MEGRTTETEAPQKALVTFVDPSGTPRAYAMGPASDMDALREEARFHLEAYLLEKALLGDPLANARFVRREQFVA